MAKTVVSHGTGQADLAAIGSEEVITNVLGIGVTGLRRKREALHAGE